MESLKQFLTAGRDLWDRWTLSQRTLVVMASLLSVLTIVGVGVWSTRPEMVMLASRLPPDQANDAIAQLEAAGISYQLSYSGSTILVPRTEMNRARLAVRELLGDQGASGELQDSIWADPNLQHVRIQRQREQRLAKSISRFTSVREAVVHISAPQPSPFVRNQTPVTASVIVDLAPGAMFSAQDASAIVALVSHGVEGLRPEGVTLMDTNGRLLSSGGDRHGDISGQLEYVGMLESHLASKAEVLLSQMLGPGRAMVRVTAAVDFTQSERQETTYDPSTKVKISETVKSETHTGTSSGPAGGPAGSSSNNTPSASGFGGSGSKIEENTTSYANTEIRDTIKEAPGRIKRLTVAAIVDLAGPGDGAAASITTADVESLIKQAVGFDAQRSDEINVVAATLAGAADFVAPPQPVWQQYESLLRNASLGLAALLMFALGLLLLRRLRPVVVHAADAEPAAESIRKLAELSIRARQNPELVAKVLENWLDDETPAADARPGTTTAGRAAA
ncbi:MAG: flagellar M-ring protein FliF [Planctomycetaceae bacterium]|nr:flagellar M-ring protein FliF [Planctomycetaceae bacterium]